MPGEKFYRFTRKSKKLPEGFDEEMFDYGKTVYIKQSNGRVRVIYRVVEDGVIMQIDEVDIPAVPSTAREVSQDAFEDNAF